MTLKRNSATNSSCYPTTKKWIVWQLNPRMNLRHKSFFNYWLTRVCLKSCRFLLMMMSILYLLSSMFWMGLVVAVSSSWKASFWTQQALWSGRWHPSRPFCCCHNLMLTWRDDQADDKPQHRQHRIVSLILSL